MNKKNITITYEYDVHYNCFGLRAPGVLYYNRGSELYTLKNTRIWVEKRQKKNKTKQKYAVNIWKICNLSNKNRKKMYLP